MNFGNTTVFQLAKAKMSYLGQRQSVLAANVANVDTAHYKAQDVKAPDFSKLVKHGSFRSGTLARTHPSHLQGIGGGGYQTIERKVLDENNPDGNGVNIDTELQKVAFTQAEYDKVVSIYRKNISLVRTAIGNPNG